MTEAGSRPPRPGLDLAFAALSSILLVFLVAPLIAVLLADPRAAYLDAWSDRELLVAVATSFACALGAVVIGVVLGTPLAYVLERRSFPGRRLVTAAISLPLVVPHPVAGIALLLLFSRNRLVGSILEDRLGIAVVSAIPGIVLAMLFVSSPLIVRAAQEGFRGTDPRIPKVAASLGASPAQVFLRVSLPLARPALAAGTVSAFARSISEFGSIAVLAYLPRTAPVLIWDRFSSYGVRSALPATAFLLATTLVLFVIWSLTDRRRGG